MPKYGCEEWPWKLPKMSKLFLDTEIQTVAEGIRRAATIHLSQDNLDRVLPELNRKGLVFTPLRKSGYYKGFAHTHKEVKPGDRFYWYGCVTKNYEDGQAFLAADKAYDHKTVGELLGFPECCSSYFIEWFPKNYDPIWTELEGEVSGYPEANQMLRYFGVRITSHLSCSPTCEGTREIGQRWFEVMKQIDEEAATALYNLLSQPMTWNSYHGVVQVETPYFVGLTHTFPILEKPRIIKWR